MKRRRMLRVALCALPFVIDGAAADPELRGFDAACAALRTEGWGAAYRADYQTARQKFQDLQQRIPTHPVGRLSLAALTWQEHLFRTRRLQSNVYRRGSKFYAASSGQNGDRGDAINPAVAATFESHISAALASAKSMADAHPASAEAMYFLGAVYGVKAAFEASAQRRFWAAMRDGIRGVKLHGEAIRLDPHFYDAYLLIGVYHYALGCLPGPFRAIAALGGVHGGKQLGISELEIVARKGRFNADDAQSVLVGILRFESQPQQALALLDNLCRHYPRSQVLLLERASTLAEANRIPEAHLAFRTLLLDPDQTLADLFHFRYGELLAVLRLYDEAERQFDAVQRAPHAYPPLVAEALQRAGQMRSLLARRSAAAPAATY